MENREQNNFDFLRLVAAVGVIVTHSYALLGFPEGDFVVKLTHGVTSWSRLGVWTFFIISGYLITLSALRSHSFFEYWVKRSLRIFPGLLVLVCVTAFVVGPLVTELPWMTYFMDRHTYGYLKNITLYGIRIELPGVFLHNPYPAFPRAVNGSLWTLAYEFTLYLLPALFIFAKKSLRFVRIVLLFTFIILALSHNWWSPRLVNQGIPVLLLNAWHLLNLGIFFLGGVLLALFKDHLRFRGLYATFGIILFLLLCWFTKLGPIAAYLLLPYCILGVAYAKFSTAKFMRFGDISYGIYIYAFLIQQTLIYLFFKDYKSPFLLSLATLCVVVPIAYLSWRFIEKPALQWKKKWTTIT